MKSKKNPLYKCSTYSEATQSCNMSYVIFCGLSEYVQLQSVETKKHYYFIDTYAYQKTSKIIEEKEDFLKKKKFKVSIKKKKGNPAIQEMNVYLKSLPSIVIELMIGGPHVPSVSCTIETSTICLQLTATVTCNYCDIQRNLVD